MAFTIMEIDRSLAGSVMMEMTGGRRPAGRVQFQVPATIRSDNKEAKYKEKDAKNVEPIAMFAGSGPREIALDWTYIVTGAKNWDTASIAEKVKKVRGYFYATMAGTIGANNANNLVIKFRAYHVVGNGNGWWSFRGMGINVKHGDTIIRDNNGQYPLRTDLSMKLKLWSQGETKDGEPMVKIVNIKKTSRIGLAWL